MDPDSAVWPRPNEGLYGRDSAEESTRLREESSVKSNSAKNFRGGDGQKRPCQKMRFDLFRIRFQDSSVLNLLCSSSHLHPYELELLSVTPPMVGVTPLQAAKRVFVSLLLTLARAYEIAVKINRESPDKDVKAAFRKVSLKVHPDKGGRSEDFAKLNAAREAWEEAKQPSDLVLRLMLDMLVVCCKTKLATSTCMGHGFAHTPDRLREGGWCVLGRERQGKVLCCVLCRGCGTL